MRAGSRRVSFRAVISVIFMTPSALVPDHHAKPVSIRIKMRATEFSTNPDTYRRRCAGVTITVATFDQRSTDSRLAESAVFIRAVLLLTGIALLTSTSGAPGPEDVALGRATIRAHDGP